MPTAKKSTKTSAKKPVKIADMKPAKDAKGGRALEDSPDPKQLTPAKLVKSVLC